MLIISVSLFMPPLLFQAKSCICHMCGAHLNRLHSCLYCVFFACFAKKHIHEHAKSKRHNLGTAYTHTHTRTHSHTKEFSVSTGAVGAGVFLRLLLHTWCHTRLPDLQLAPFVQISRFLPPKQTHSHYVHRAHKHTPSLDAISNASCFKTKAA